MERKLATVLFADLVGSTELLASADPEVVRRRVSRFFDRVSHCVEAYGGVVEKFAGDAVMAAFGLPQSHEDDAERGARAALAILTAVEDLGLDVRIGLEAGEVVYDDAESTFATGEAVNVAARLQQAAAPGEILFGPVARGLLGRVEAEERGHLELRGLGRTVAAWKLVCAPDDPGRALVVSAPFIGREEEVELLHNTWARALRDRRAHLVTIFGDPGVGKSRMAREFFAGVERATLLSGRCLPYGEGITYWPLAEMVKAAAGITDDDPVGEAVEKLREACGDDAVADLLGLASGLLDRFTDDSSAQEIIWAAHEWTAELASAQALILCFEDIHWAEEPLLDLIEQLAERVRDVPLLVLCLARPELLDIRAGWGGGRVRSVSIELQPLAQSESAELVEALVAGAELSDAQRAAVLAKAEGNPLFVEETVRMLLERGADEAVGRIPDTVQALIAARIDRLRPRTKSVLQRAALIGRVFWSGAVETLLSDPSGVDDALRELVSRDFVTEESRSSISGERAYRFRHVLIRDVAYAGLSKDARAMLHRRFADWLRDRGVEELVEIRSYHLDHAAALLAELDGAVPADLASEAAAALEIAGRRALWREANVAGRTLLLRAVELEPTLERRFQAARAAWRLADLPAVSREMESVAADAALDGDAEIEGAALTALAEVTLLRDGDLPRARGLVTKALEVLEPDDRFRTLMISAKISRWVGNIEGHEADVRAGLELAKRLGRIDLEAQATRELAEALSTQLRHAEAMQTIDRATLLAEESGSIMARAHSLAEAGNIQTQMGDLDGAATSLEQARTLFTELGASMNLGRTLLRLGDLALARGDLDGAARFGRESIRVLKPLEDRGTLCESQRLLADTLVRQGRVSEAERFALEAVETVGPHDASSQATTRMSLADVRAAQGRDEEAEVLLREALERVEGTGYRSVEACATARLDQFLRDRGREDEAIAARAAALAVRDPAPTVRDNVAPFA
jgi:class 3 adenylate cyclase/tetratricopeptide (TPR) repeat protein